MSLLGFPLQRSALARSALKCRILQHAERSKAAYRVSSTKPLRKRTKASQIWKDYQRLADDYRQERQDHQQTEEWGQRMEAERNNLQCALAVTIDMPLYASSTVIPGELISRELA